MQTIGAVLSGHKSQHWGLLTGEAGLILFLCHYSRFQKDQWLLDQAIDRLGDLVEAIDQDPDVHFSFASGLAGVGWLIEHLIEGGFLESDSGDLLQELDQPIGTFMVYEMERGHYDYLHGATGMAFYFIKRMKSAPTVARPYLEQFVRLLDQTSLQNGSNIRWGIFKDNRIVSSAFNLSLSHGNAALLHILLRAREAQILPEVCDRLIKGLHLFLMAEAGPITPGSLTYPGIVQDSTLPTPSRLAWCYGDMGMGCSLWHYSGLFNDAHTGSFTLEMLRNAAKIRGQTVHQVVDAGLCHGSTGLAHIFGHFFRATGDPLFQEAAEYWFDFGLRQACNTDGLAGFKAYHPKKAQPWYVNADYLEGIAGIGLAYIQALSSTPCSWDESLFIA